MSRKGKKRQQAKAKRPPKQQFSFGRYYRHYRETFNKAFMWAGIGIGTVAIIVLAIMLVKKGGVSRTKAELVRDARRDFVLGYPDRAILNYHQAENADPADMKLKLETAMARAWAEMLRGAQPQGAFTAATKVLTEDSTVAVAHAGLAQLYERMGDPKQAVTHSYATLRYASADNDTPSALAVSVILASHYRQMDQPDSAAQYGEQAVDLANAVHDETNLFVAESEAGMAMYQQGKLDKGRLFFEDILAKASPNSGFLVSMGKTGMAEYYLRAGRLDSAVAVASDAVSLMSGSQGSEILARASSVLGRALKESGDLTGAVGRLTASLSGWESLRRQSELIDNLNDLSQTYQLQKDYFNTRKYLYAAARLAAKYSFKSKDHYTADMNVRLMSYLSQDEYLRAGSEGDQLIRQYSLW